MAAPLLGVLGAGLAGNALLSAAGQAEGHAGAVGTMAGVGASAEAALAGGSEQQRVEALDAVTKALEAQAEREANTGILEETLAGLSQMFGGGNVMEQQADASARLRALEARLQASLAAPKPGVPGAPGGKPAPSEIAPASTDRIGLSVARYLEGVRLKVEVEKMPTEGGGGSGNRGPMQPGGTTSGAEAR